MTIGSNYLWLVALFRRTWILLPAPRQSTGYLLSFSTRKTSYLITSEPEASETCLPLGLTTTQMSWRKVTSWRLHRPSFNTLLRIDCPTSRPPDLDNGFKLSVSNAATLARVTPDA